MFGRQIIADRKTLTFLNDTWCY